MKIEKKLELFIGICLFAMAVLAILAIAIVCSMETASMETVENGESVANATNISRNTSINDTIEDIMIDTFVNPSSPIADELFYGD